MTQFLLSMLYAYFGYSLRYLASATQKIGLKVRETNKAKGSILWSLGLLSGTVSIVIVMYAVSLGNVSIVGAMAGTGLITLAFFSALVMKEQIRRREMFGIMLILIAAALLGGFIQESKPMEVLVGALFLILGIVICVYTCFWVALRKHRVKGVLVGMFAGTLSGFVPLFQKVATSDIGRTSTFIPSLAKQQLAMANPGLINRLGCVLLNPYSLLWISLSIISTIVIQFAYKHDKAIRIIPAFSASYILIPVLLGFFCLKESLHPLQWLGALLIIVGVLVLTMPRLRVYSQTSDVQSHSTK
jgi:uncharacterized membrane protein